MELIIPMQRKILLSGSIESSTVSEVINKINEINYEDKKNLMYYKNYNIEPIEIFINSVGGDCYSCFALVDVIKQSKTPVHTISIGCSMSAGLSIYLAGHKRYIGEYSVLMFHDVTSFIIDKTPGIKEGLDEAVRLQNNICKLITTRSKVSQSTLDDYINRKADWFINAEDAIEFKLADGYYKGDE